jgi:Asp-tRNA(Asn)/Glu-tRNA(Gln) amidotransferase A subunit family amidase
MTTPLLVQPISLEALRAPLRTGALDLSANLAQTCERVNALEPTLAALVPEGDRDTRLQDEAAALRARFPNPVERPPLYGILVGVKDIMRTDGFPTRAGSQFPPDMLAGAQAACVSRLRELGALVLGKTVTAEFAYIAPGPTRNPHNPAHTPGGSSRGSAAGVAAGYFPLALGTQTVGSLLRPAAFCGVVSLKPSFGRIPTDGVLAVSPSLDHVGFFTADVASARFAAALLYDGWTPENARQETRPALGIPEGPYLAQASDEALSAFERQVDALKASGYRVVRLPLLADIEQIAQAHFRLMAAEMAQIHEAWFAAYGPLYREQTTQLIRQGQAVAPAEAEQARSGQPALRQQLAATMDSRQIDVWITPAATGPAPEGLSSTGNSSMNLPWTYAGMPALALPAGKAKNGLPLGLQVVGRYGADEQLLVWADEIERVLKSTF